MSLKNRPDEAAWRCININCPVQVVERLIHFASKDAMDIRSLGTANVQKFFDLKIITDIPSIYNIDWDKVRTLEGFGEKSVSNLKAAIEGSKKQTLNRVIFGLGIRHCGENTSKILASAVSHISELYGWDVEKLSTLQDIGPKVATAVVDFFARQENRDMIERLAKAGVNLANEHKGEQKTGGLLTGKTFLFTGSLSHFKRSDAEAIVEEKGGSILGGVSSKLNYLVVGEDAGSKLGKSKKTRHCKHTYRAGVFEAGGTVNFLFFSKLLYLCAIYFNKIHACGQYGNVYSYLVCIACQGI